MLSFLVIAVIKRKYHKKLSVEREMGMVVPNLIIILRNCAIPSRHTDPISVQLFLFKD